MTRSKTIGTYFLFFTLPLIAVLKGKGIVVSLFLAFFLFNGLTAFKDFVRHKEWRNISVKSLPLFFFVFFFLFFMLSFLQNEACSIWRPLKLIGLLSLVFFTLKGSKTLDFSEKERIVSLFFKAYIFYALFLIFEIYGGSWVSKFYTGSKDYNVTLFIRGTVILTFFFLPFTLLIKKKYGKIYGLLFSLFLLLLVLIKAQPSAARLAVLVAGIFFAAGYFRKAFAATLLGIVGVYILVAPLLSLHFLNRNILFNHLHSLPTSYQHRVEIWHEVSKNVIKKPWLGHGFDYSSHIKESPHRCSHHSLANFKKISFNDKIVSKTPHLWGGVVCYKETILSSHPHNGALQIWLEFGFLGVCFVFFLLYRFAQYASSLPSLLRGYTYALFGLCLVYWSVSFGLWQNWMIALATLTFILFQLINGLPSKNKGR